VRDPKAALAYMREHLGLLKRHGFLEAGVELEDPKLVHARAELALETIREPRERTLSDETLDYLLPLVFEETAPPPYKGRPSTKFRDHWIVQAVAAGAAYGLTPTRNRERASPAQPTACEIAATTLAELGIDLAEASVEDIWSRRSDVADIHRRQAIGDFSPKDRASEYRARAKAWLVRYAAEKARFDRSREELDRHLAALARVREK
jgi:hypothetical protein